MIRISTEDLFDFLDHTSLHLLPSLHFLHSFLHLLTLRYSYWLLVSLRVAPERFPPCPVSCNTFLTFKVTRCPGLPRAKGLLDEGLAVLKQAQFRQTRTSGHPTALPTPRLLPLPCGDYGVPGMSVCCLSPWLPSPALKLLVWGTPPREGTYHSRPFQKPFPLLRGTG